MTTQPEALRLADALMTLFPSREDRERAAAELRRLHAEVERLSLDSIHTCHSECQRPVCRLTRERDALLKVLKEAELVLAEKLRRLGADPNVSPTTHRIRAAIEAVEGEKT